MSDCRNKIEYIIDCEKALREHTERIEVCTKIKRSGIRFPQLVMYRSVGGTVFHTAFSYPAVIGTW